MLSKIKKLKKIILLILLPFITFGVYAQTKSRSKSKISSQKTIKLTEETINADALDSLLAREVRKARETKESQNYYFLKNGELMEQRGGSTSSFAKSWGGSIIGFTKGIYEDKMTVIYWTGNEAFMCVLHPNGGWSSKEALSCECGLYGKGVVNVTFVGNNKLIINCDNGKVIKKNTYGNNF